MIRLGSLAGYAFEGPRLLAGWTPPAGPGVFAVLVTPDPERHPERYAVVYAGAAEDLSGLDLRHPAAPCWIRRAGSKWAVHVAVHDPPGATARYREELVKELIAVYHPGCNGERYGPAWREAWIGSYSAATADPLTTDHDPG
jgi:hypothetical protein